MTFPPGYRPDPWGTAGDHDRRIRALEAVPQGVSSGGSSLSAAILATADLEAFWKLNELSGSVAFDSGPNGYDLSPRATTSPPTWDAETAPSDEPAAGFGSGKSEYLSSVPAFSGDLTALIFFHRGDTAHGDLLGQGDPPSSNQAGFSLGVGAFNEGANNRFKVYVGDSTGGPHVVEGDTAVTTGWHMGVARRTSHIWKLFVDGAIQTGSYDDSGTNYNAATGAWIGRSDTSGVSLFTGSLSYGAIFSRSLSAVELESFWDLFQGNASPDGYVLTADGDGDSSFEPPTIEVDNGVVARFKRLILGTGMTGVDNTDDTITLSVSGGPPTGSAGGDLTGTYPNPTIAANAVDTTELADSSVTAAKLDSGAAAANTVAQADGAGNVSYVARIKSLAKFGGTALTGSVTLSEGTNVTITPSGNDLAIAAVIASMAGANVTLVDAGGYFPVDNAEAALQALAAGSVGPTPAIVRIADTTLGGSASSIDFSSIPATYKHLLAYVSGATDRGASAAFDQIAVRMNNDSSANYDAQQVQATAATPTAAETFAGTFFRVLQVPASGRATNRGGGGVVFFPDYAGTVMSKAGMGFSGAMSNTSSGQLIVGFLAGGWRSTAAIDRLTFISANAANLLTGTRITLYGLA